MKFKLSKAINKAYIYYKKNKVYDVNDEFLRFTGYSYDEIVGKSFEELIKLLRADSQSCFKEERDEYNCYIFTKQDQVKEVKITQKNLIEEDEKVYFIEEEENQLLKGILATCVDNRKNIKESIAIFSYPDFIHLKFSKTYKSHLNLLEFKEDNPIGDVFLHPEYILNAIEDKTSYYEDELEFISKSGNITYWSINAVLIFEEGQAKYLRCSFYNETEDVMTRKLLEKQKIEMEIILNNIPDSIVMLNSKGEYTYVNKPTLHKFFPYHYGEKSLNNRDGFKFFKYSDINGNELSFYDTPDARVLRGERITNFILVRTSHLSTTYYECNGIPIYDKSGNIEGAVLIYRDIGNDFKIEEYHALAQDINHIEIKFATLSYVDFKIRYINNNSFKLIKKHNASINSVVQVIGKDFFDFYCWNVDEKKEIIANIKQCFETKASSYRHKQRYMDGETVKCIKTIFQPIFDKDNKIERLHVIGMDITDEETRNQKMSIALEAQEELFINTSHELKTPLNLIFSASQLTDMYLKSEFIEDKRHKIDRNNKIIKQNCYRLIKLVNNILDASKIEEGFYELNLENRNIVSVVEDIIQSVSEYIQERGMSIIFDSEIEEKIMAFDFYKIERVILNLLSNAIKFSDSKGKIMVNIMDKYDFIEISVSDNGIGIGKEDIGDIFNKFKQADKSLNRKAEGTGIGLSLVKSIVELHKGEVSVESTLGHGSTFKIKLPVITVDKPIKDQDDYNNSNGIETMKLELSDIYS